MSFLAFWKAWKEERRNTVECKECAMPFNAAKQAGVCPHIPIQDFIYGQNNIQFLINSLKAGRIDPFGKEITELYKAIISARNEAQRMRVIRIPDFGKEEQ